MLKDTRGIIGSLKSKDKQYNGQNKETKNDLQNTTQRTKDRVTRTPLNFGRDSR
jgi:hypothetical protein